MALVNYYRELLLENRRWIKWSLWWFLVSAGIGVLGFFLKPDLLQTILDVFSEKFGPDPALDMNLAKEIFIQNLSASAMALFGGVVLGIMPAIILVVNGFLVGFIVTSLLLVSIEDPVTGIGVLTGGLIPHAIFELPAFFFASAFGLKLGLAWLSREASGKRWQTFRDSAMQTLAIMPLVIFLLAIAAIIEVFVSGAIVDRF